jgi:HEAT repeat protein
MPEEIRGWIVALESLDAPTREAAAYSLVARGPEAIPALLPLLCDARPLVRAEAVGVLSQIGGRGAEVIPVFVSLLDDPRPEVRAQAAGILGDIGSAAAGAAEKLYKVSRDRNASVRRRATGALEKIAPAFLERMRRRRLVRHVAAALALLLLATGAVALETHGILSGLVRRESFFRFRPTHYWLAELNSDRAEAAQETLLAGGQDALPVLSEASREENDGSIKAIYLLGSFGSPQAAGILIPLLESKRQNIQTAVATSLGRMGSSAVDALPHLWARVRNPESSLWDRRECMHAIERIAPDIPAQGVLRLPRVSGTDEVKSLAFAADGERLLAVPEKTTHAWSITDRSQTEFKGPPDSRIIALAPDGRTVAVNDLHGRLFLWDASCRTCPGTSTR